MIPKVARKEESLKIKYHTGAKKLRGASMGLLTDTRRQAPNAEKDVYTSRIVPHYIHQLARARSQERARVSQTEACGTCPQSIFLIDISAPGAERRGRADSHSTQHRAKTTARTAAAATAQAARERGAF